MAPPSDVHQPGVVGEGRQLGHSNNPCGLGSQSQGNHQHVSPRQNFEQAAGCDGPVGTRKRLLSAPDHGHITAKRCQQR